MIGILLGGGITNDGQLTKDTKRRANKAFHLLQDGKIEELILSGKYGKDKRELTEAEVYKQYLLHKGIANHKLIKEESSRDTIGNAVFSKEITIRKKLGNDIMLITNNLHMPRALFIFKHVFGETYTIHHQSSRAPFVKTLYLWLKERRSWQFDKFLLGKTGKGDHKEVKKVILQWIPFYRE